ncbi:MAG: hypothetical protein ACJ741_06100 [Pyrinomonadaceae bacterium]
MNRTKTRPLVVAHADCDLYHSSYVTTGLCRLADAGRIDLKFRLPAAVFARHRGRFTVRLDVHDQPGGEPRKVCVDLHDQNDYFANASLRDCGLYFKRSYNREEIAKLPPELAAKVLPFGPTFGCRPWRERGLASRWAGSLLSHTQRIGGWRTLSRHDGLRSLYDFAPQSSYRALRPLGEYERGRLIEPEPRVYLNTRLFPEESEQVAALNRRRIELVRRLRAELGPRFLGGLIPGELVPADCRTNAPADRRAHVENLNSSLVCVYTNGLHDSVAWKLGEYMAAARCVVGEPLCNELAGPLTGGAGVFFSASTDECVAACLRLVADPELAFETRRGIAAYYASFVRPDDNLWRVVSRAPAATEMAWAGSAALA